MAQEQSNLSRFMEAGMLSQQAVNALTDEQRETIESWDQHTVQTLIATYQETDEIHHGVRWI
jgi:hypothetical protein